jgi:hypothetical protein
VQGECNGHTSAFRRFPRTCSRSLRGTACPLTSPPLDLAEEPSGER